MDTGATLSGLLAGLTCDASSRFSDSKNQFGDYYCSANGGGCGGAAPEFQPAVGSYALGPNGGCGTLTYCKQADSCAVKDSLACAICQAQTATLAQIIPILSGISSSLVSADYAYRDFYANSASSQNNNWQWIYGYCASTTNADGSAKKVIPKDQCCVRGYSSFNTTCKANPGSGLLPAADMPQESGGKQGC